MKKILPKIVVFINANLKKDYCIFAAPLNAFTVLNLPLFIAKKISGNRQSTFSKFILQLATVATAISVAVMIIAVAIVQGFKTQIRDKMFVFWGNAQVTMFNANPSSIIGDAPFANDEQLIKKINAVKGVTAVYPYIVKPTILKGVNGLEGLKLKGVTSSYPLKTNASIQFEGNPIHFPDTGYSNDIQLSTTTLRRMNLKIGESVIAVFFNPDQGTPSVRKLNICGSYHTGIEEVDQGFGLCDIRFLRQLNHWSANEISALQINMENYQNAVETSEKIYRDFITPPMSISPLQEIYPFIFSWLDFQNTNAALVLIIMAIVAAINMATALVIYLLERTQMVGTLKALGMQNKAISKVFLLHSLRVAGKGILWGTLIGIAACLIQLYFQPLRLNEEVYYMKAAPISINWWQILLIDTGTLLFCTLTLLLPLLMVQRVKIVNALKFK